MVALDCVSPNGKVTATDSQDVFTISLSSNLSLNEQRRDEESQMSKSEATRKRCSWLNFLVDLPIILIYVSLIGIFELGVIPSHQAGFYCNDPGLSFPYTGDTVPSWLLVPMLFFAPFVVIWTTEYVYVQSDYTKTKAAKSLRRTIGVYRNYILGLMANLGVIEIMKGITGYPRPNFFELCEPDTGKTCNGTEHVSSFTCTSTYSSWTQSDSYHSFPSGHTSLSVYCGIYIAWYLQNRAFNWRNQTVFLVPAVQMLALTFAVVSSLTRITDRMHHWWDVLVGAAIGLLSALYAVKCISKNFSYTKKDIEKSIDSQRSPILYGRQGR